MCAPARLCWRGLEECSAWWKLALAGRVASSGCFFFPYIFHEYVSSLKTSTWRNRSSQSSRNLQESDLLKSPELWVGLVIPIKYIQRHKRHKMMNPPTTYIGGMFRKLLQWIAAPPRCRWHWHDDLDEHCGHHAWLCLKIDRKGTQHIPFGWWFGTFFISPYIGNVIIPTDELILFRGVDSTTNHIHRLSIDYP